MEKNPTKKIYIFVEAVPLGPIIHISAVDTISWLLHRGGKNLRHFDLRLTLDGPRLCGVITTIVIKVAECHWSRSDDCSVSFLSLAITWDSHTADR
jgi:hypothetical protein